MTSLNITYCGNSECPLRFVCRLGQPNWPKVEKDWEPRVPALKFGWFGERIASGGQRKVATDWYCDRFEEIEL
ncbi:hypothetical protein MLD52_09035 [Puniceicoccaceae bacterium K14]|nr:hypothetical protein [Puniceicoccaceae bacterium K14]